MGFECRRSAGPNLTPMSKLDKYKTKHPTLYQDLLKDETTNDLELESVILKDIDRTFPKHTLFKDKYGLG